MLLGVRERDSAQWRRRRDRGQRTEAPFKKYYILRAFLSPSRTAHTHTHSSSYFCFCVRFFSLFSILSCSSSIIYGKCKVAQTIFSCLLAFRSFFFRSHIFFFLFIFVCFAFAQSLKSREHLLCTLWMGIEWDRQRASEIRKKNRTGKLTAATINGRTVSVKPCDGHIIQT